MKKRIFKAKIAYRKLFRPMNLDLEGKTLYIDRRKFSPAIVDRLIRERYERSEIRMIKEILSTEDRVLEMGAGMGLISMIAADVVGDDNIISYEADPEMVEIARWNFLRNEHNIEIRHGLLDPGNVQPASTRKFYVQSDFWASSSGREQGSILAIDVPVSGLNELLRSYRPTVLLIDIEGDEVELLMGVTDPGSVRKIILEIHYQWAGRKETNQMMRHLFSMGFEMDLDLSGSGHVFLYRG